MDCSFGLLWMYDVNVGMDILVVSVNHGQGCCQRSKVISR